MPRIIEIRVPDVPSLGRILLSRWLVPADSYIKAGQEILELEADTATVTLPSPVSGKLEQIARDAHPVLAGQLMGRIEVEER